MYNTAKVVCALCIILLGISVVDLYYELKGINSINSTMSTLVGDITGEYELIDKPNFNIISYTFTSSKKYHKMCKLLYNHYEDKEMLNSVLSSNDNAKSNVTDKNDTIVLSNYIILTDYIEDTIAVDINLSNVISEYLLGSILVYYIKIISFTVFSIFGVLSIFDFFKNLVIKEIPKL